MCLKWRRSAPTLQALGRRPFRVLGESSPGKQHGVVPGTRQRVRIFADNRCLDSDAIWDRSSARPSRLLRHHRHHGEVVSHVQQEALTRIRGMERVSNATKFATGKKTFTSAGPCRFAWPRSRRTWLRGTNPIPAARSCSLHRSDRQAGWHSPELTAPIATRTRRHPCTTETGQALLALESAFRHTRQAPQCESFVSSS